MKQTRFVIAYDKFKDCLKASQLCNITGKALEKSLGAATVQIKSIPLADGGDGFLDCIEEFFTSTKKTKSGGHFHHPFHEYDMRKMDLKATGPLGTTVDVGFLRRRLFNTRKNRHIIC